MSYKGTTKKLFIPDFVLIQETIDKFGYNPNELYGSIYNKYMVVCICFICDKIYDIQICNAIRKFKENKLCISCANKEKSINNAEVKSLLMKEKIKNGTFIPPMLGKNHTKKSKDKMILSHTGMNWEILFGKEKSEFYKKRNSENYTGKGNPFYGKEHTDETKLQISKQSTKNARKGNKSNFYGKKYWPKREKLFFKDIYFRSNWEILTVKYFEENNIKWQYEPKYFIINDKCTYTPDFYLSELDKWIEVKGYWRDDAITKFAEFKIIYPNINIEIWDKTKLEELNIIKKKIQYKNDNIQ